MAENPEPAFTPPPENGTEALLEYSWASECHHGLFHFFIDLALRADFVAHVARQALDGKDDYKALTPAELAKATPGAVTMMLRRSRQELLEMFVSREVDNFEVYLVAMVRLVLNKDPRIFSDSKPELTLGRILQFDSIQAFSRAVIEGKVNALSYEGFRALEAWCTQRSIPLVVPPGGHDRVVELVALRNIIVHNRGYVDERYRTAVPSSSTEVGLKRKIEVDDLFGAVALLRAIVEATDTGVTSKFRLSTVNIRDEIRKRSIERWPKIADGAGFSTGSVSPPAVT